MKRVLDPQRLPAGRVLAASTALLTLGAVLAGLLLADVRQPPFQGLDESWAGWITSLRSQFWDGVNGFLNLAGYRGSFPSGHVASTAAFLAVIALLVGRAWAAAFAGAGVLAMMVSRTYLSAHWLTDTVGAVCLAVPAVFLLWLSFQNICTQENGDARRLLSWRARASRRRRATAHPGSGS